MTSGLRSHGPAGTDPDQQRIEALERLQRLRADGVLSDEELAREKARVMDDTGGSTSTGA